MNQSQENCLVDSHRLTHERWGGDYSVFIVTDSRLSAGFLQNISRLKIHPLISVGDVFLFTTKELG